MRHRLGTAAQTHIGGNPDAVLLSNTGELPQVLRDMIDVAIEIYFDGFGVDYEITDDEIKFGTEPAYQFDQLKIICIKRNKGESYIQTGQARGMWGGGIRKTTKHYREYKRNCKFIEFIDEWHNKLFPS